MKKLKCYQFNGNIIAHYSEREASEAYSNDMTVSLLEAERMAKPLPDTHIIRLLPEQVDRVFFLDWILRVFRKNSANRKSTVWKVRENFLNGFLNKLISESG